MKKKKTKKKKKYFCKGCGCSYESKRMAELSSRICKENNLCK